ncbi:MAG: hypothetical protein AAF799_10545 [Myxococcota bacterium]
MDRAPSVTPLELWDMPVEGRPLQHYRQRPSFARQLAAVVAGLRTGALGRDIVAHAVELARDIDTVVLAGGGVEPAIEASLAELGLTVHVADDPSFAAVRAGWTTASPSVDLCADLGQTSLKLFDGRHAWRVERDERLAPMARAAGDETSRSTTLDFIAEALGTHAASGRVLLALPCEVGSDQAPTVCTYCWRDPDPTWRAELAERMGIELEHLRLVNDAELAATAAFVQLGPRPTPTLVLTIGFGVGAAIVEPSS